MLVWSSTSLPTPAVGDGSFSGALYVTLPTWLICLGWEKLLLHLLPRVCVLGSVVPFIHHLRRGSAFTRSRLHQLYRLSSISTCGVNDSVKRQLFQCKDLSAQQRPPFGGRKQIFGVFFSFKFNFILYFSNFEAEISRESALKGDKTKSHLRFHQLIGN